MEIEDAELELLRASAAALEAVDDHGRALSFVETLNAQKAEIARLKAELKTATEEIGRLVSLLIEHGAASAPDVAG